MISVYTLPGLSPGVTRSPDNYLSSQLFSSPFTRRDIAYPNYAPLQAFLDIAKGKALEAAQQPGRKILNGHSMGGQALAALLRDEPDIDPDENVFVISGFPESKYGGKLTVPFADGKIVYDGVGIPEATPFRVFVVARQYDHFADWPTINVRAAVDNINDAQARAIHVDYSDVRIGDSRNVGFVDGNITYLWVPTFPLPSCRRARWSAVREAVEDSKVRAAIEQGYNRPVAIPPQTVKWYGGQWGFDTATRRFVKRTTPPTWNPFA